MQNDIREENSNEENCAICLDQLNEEMKTSKCHKNFHPECLKKWIKELGKKICPICRAEYEMTLGDLDLEFIKELRKRANTVNSKLKDHLSKMEEVADFDPNYLGYHDNYLLKKDIEQKISHCEYYGLELLPHLEQDIQDRNSETILEWIGNNPFSSSNHLDNIRMVISYNEDYVNYVLENDRQMDRPDQAITQELELEMGFI